MGTRSVIGDKKVETARKKVYKTLLSCIGVRKMGIEYESLPFTFLGLDEESSSFEKARVVILPVPYDRTAFYAAGTRLGPLRMIEASRYMETLDEELGAEIKNIGIHTLPLMEVPATGPRDMVELMEDVVGQIHQSGKFPVILGGEHSIGIGAVRALASRIKDFGVVQLDAHADLREDYEGSKYSHACFASRASEQGPVFQIGIRSRCSDESKNPASHPVWTVTAAEFMGGDLWKSEMIERMTENVYLSVDLDVFDPSVLPAVGSPEPGGLMWNDVLEAIRFTCTNLNVVGMEFTELAPIPGIPAYDFTAAKLAYKAIGYRFFAGEGKPREAADEK